jgi:hypothetical protein
MITMTASQHTTCTPPATIGATVRRASRRAAAALRHVHREQTLVWELWWQANRATVPSTGPLRWVLTLDGHRLAGRHLPAPHHTDARDAA